MPPKTDGLAVLCRTTPLSDQEWLDTIETRRQAIKPHLDTFTLSTLGQVKCLQLENITHAISDNSPECVGGEFDLNTQGIFRIAPWNSRVLNQRESRGLNYEREFRTLGGILYIWGLTRKAQWIIASVSYICEAGYKGRGYERTTKVEIEEAMVLKILSLCNVRYEEIWRELSKEVHLWNKKREELYNTSLNLTRMCDIEELALSLIPREESVSIGSC